MADNETDLEKSIPQEEYMAYLKELNEILIRETESYKTQINSMTEKNKVAVAAANEALIAKSTVEAKFKEIQLDYENLKKRSATVKESALEEGIIKAVMKILPVVDNFERALPSITDPVLAKGFEMIYKQLQDALGALGVHKIPEVELFDPEIHNAVMQVPAADPEDSGYVVEIFQEGYMIGGKVIRHAQVKVAQ